MEILIGLVCLMVVGLMLSGWLGLGLFAYGARTRKKAEANAPAILDAAFDGSPNVVFKVNLESPSYETVVMGAMERGYSMTHETNDTADGIAKTLIFKRDGERDPAGAKDSP